MEASDKPVSVTREGERDGGVGGQNARSSGMSKTWWVGRQSCSVSTGPSEDILSIFEVGTGDAGE